VTEDALAWWLVVQAIGLLALPIALTVFRRLPGAGYAFAKPLGILLGAYGFWLALSLHLLPNRPGSIVWAFIAVAAVSFLLYRRDKEGMQSALQERLPFIVACEVVFALSFVGAVYLRSFLPEIAGTEKPMDFMLLNAASRSTFYPPADGWLAGFDVSYYYFGFVIQAMLAKLAVVTPAVAFNLGLAGTAALAATAAFGLGYELVKGHRLSQSQREESNEPPVAAADPEAEGGTPSPYPSPSTRARGSEQSPSRWRYANLHPVLV